MLCKHEDFVERVIDRYAQLRQTVLSEEYLMDYIDQTLAYLGPAVERNNQRWQQAMTQWEPLTPVERNVHSHEEAVEQLKQWLISRGDWLTKTSIRSGNTPILPATRYTTSSVQGQGRGERVELHSRRHGVPIPGEDTGSGKGWALIRKRSGPEA